MMSFLQEVVWASSRGWPGRSLVTVQRYSQPQRLLQLLGLEQVVMSVVTPM